ncbi:Beta-galactosidase C-terminal domain [Streptomyces sp. NPDC060054]|uniref:Beta-galactosidase C-terminal domain n=1 Tax=unclassified Streptomyces TaxID=2593676 RepID=UPI003695AE8E
MRSGTPLFLLHHGRDTMTVELPGAYVDLLTGTKTGGRVVLGRYGVAVPKETGAP